MNYQQALRKAVAYCMEGDCGCCINRRLDGSHYISDWYDSDSTIHTLREDGSIKWTNSYFKEVA